MWSILSSLKERLSKNIQNKDRGNDLDLDMGTEQKSTLKKSKTVSTVPKESAPEVQITKQVPKKGRVVESVQVKKEPSSSDMQYHIKRFFIKYKDLIDSLLYNSNPSRYKSKLNGVGKLLSNEEASFEFNVLVSSTRDFAKEVFLTGMSTLEKYHSYLLLNVQDLIDIYFGNKEDYLGLHSIKQDILCITLGYYESYHSKGEEIVIQVMMDRANKGKRTWIFIKDDEDVAIIDRYPNIMEIFLDDDKRDIFKYYTI